MTAHYDSDFYGWTQEQADLLRSGRLTELDTQNLLEEIEAMGRSERCELESRLQVLFMHLLKWEHQPSLKSKLPELMANAYGDAVISAERETGLERSIFPESCPWTLEQALSV